MYNVDKTVLNELFECREENLCTLTETDKERIKRLVTKNDTYTMLLEKIDKLSDDEKGKEIITYETISNIELIQTFLSS